MDVSEEAFWQFKRQTCDKVAFPSGAFSSWLILERVELRVEDEGKVSAMRRCFWDFGLLWQLLLGLAGCFSS